MESVLESFNRRTYNVNEAVSRGNRYKKFPMEPDKDKIIEFLVEHGFEEIDIAQPDSLIYAATSTKKNLYCDYTGKSTTSCVLFSNGEYCHRIYIYKPTGNSSPMYTIINKSGRIVVAENNWEKFRENCILDFYDWK